MQGQENSSKRQSYNNGRQITYIICAYQEEKKVVIKKE